MSTLEPNSTHASGRLARTSTGRAHDEETLVKRFIRIADAANKSPPQKRSDVVLKLAPIAWKMTCFIDPPSFFDQQVR